MVKNSKFKNKKILIVVSLLAILIACGVAFAYYKHTKNTDNPAEQLQPSNQAGINLNPPTLEENNSGDERKEQIVEEQNKSKNNSGETKTKQTTVIITDAGQYDNIIEVRSFIPNHYEDGTCTINFQKGSSKVSKSTPAYRDASTTICTNPLFKRSEFPSAGDWQVTVSYKSPGAVGVSETRTIKIK